MNPLLYYRSSIALKWRRVSAFFSRARPMLLCRSSNSRLTNNVMITRGIFGVFKFTKFFYQIGYQPKDGIHNDKRSVFVQLLQYDHNFQKFVPYPSRRLPFSNVKFYQLLFDWLNVKMSNLEASLEVPGQSVAVK